MKLRHSFANRTVIPPSAGEVVHGGLQVGQLGEPYTPDAISRMGRSSQSGLESDRSGCTMRDIPAVLPCTYEVSHSPRLPGGWVRPIRCSTRQ